MKSRFGFILVKTQIGENIGASARALKNFGFSKLSIVSPRDGWPNYKARMSSVGAYDMLQKVKVYEELIKKLVQCNESLNYVEMESLLRKHIITLNQ